jgi:Ca2+-binding EF-hand superfamily protein
VFQQFANTAVEGEAAVLDHKKMKRALKALGVGKELNADAVLEKMDANKDGTIDLQEWEKFMTPELRAAIESKLNDKNKVDGFRPLVDIAKVFDQFDTDKSGDLSKDEIKNALVCLGLSDTINVDDLLKDMDDDANGEISIEEFRNNLPKSVLQAMSAKLNEVGLIEGF